MLFKIGNKFGEKIKHGHSREGHRSLTYNSWRCMRARCNCESANHYEIYGGRGITVCERWKKFENFLEDMGERPDKQHTLDRVKVNENYCKENCKWATKSEQRINQRKVDKEDVGF